MSKWLLPIVLIRSVAAVTIIQSIWLPGCRYDSVSLRAGS
jgi:hypothetical protein